MATEKWLIDANKFKHKMKLEFLDRRNKFISMNDLFECIDDMPTVDAVEVVRCKDCKWWKDCHCTNINGAMGVVENPDWFCAAGERMAND